MIHAEDGEILHVSGAWARLSGYDHEQIPDLAEWTRRAYGPEADFHYRLIMDKHKNQSELEAEREVTVRTRDGGHRHWLMTSAPLGRLPDGRGLRQSVAVDITERIQAEQALRDSEQRFRALAENSVVGLWQITPEGRTLYVNPAMARLLEVDSSDELRGEPADAFYTEGSAARIHEQLRKRQKGETTVYEAELVGRRGTHRHMLIHGAPIFDAEGYLQSNFGTFVDITERKEAERRQKLLTDELDHRVKNNLASVMGLATRTLDASRSLSQFREAFLGRLRAMTRTHDALARARWEGVDLTDVARLVAGAFADEQHQRLSLEGPRILLPARLALPLSLAMHELAANAVHHGALSRPEGQVELAWSIDERENRIRLRWQETGGPRARKPRRPGVGLQLIEGLITYEAGGRLNMAFEPTGLRCEMDLPTPET
jgi:PAS domain S-box-containing protein